jgi:hypothetical protein
VEEERGCKQRERGSAEPTDEADGEVAYRGKSVSGHRVSAV